MALAKTLALRRPTPRHLAFYIAATIGVLVGSAAFVFSRGLAIEIGASAFFLTYLVLVGRQLPKLSAVFLRAHADEADAPVPLIFLATIATVSISATSLFILINSAGARETVALVLSIVSVLLGWFSVNTMMGLHYAYEYYESRDASPGKRGQGPFDGGLLLPDGEKPDGVSFLYFSNVVGMTAQVSDVQVSSNKMRRLVLVHGVFSFFFNTIILAAAVNIIVSLGH
ncbi:MAG: putative rane protein [Hyphomicrobiales bacterium]|nr:putative rane protein [Hyphomicrobiales bacterium]